MEAVTFSPSSQVQYRCSVWITRPCWFILIQIITLCYLWLHFPVMQGAHCSARPVHLHSRTKLQLVTWRFFNFMTESSCYWLTMKTRPPRCQSHKAAAARILMLCEHGLVEEATVCVGRQEEDKGESKSATTTANNCKKTLLKNRTSSWQLIFRSKHFQEVIPTWT